MLRLRVVHVSTGTGFPNRSSDGSYTPSTRRDGLSDRQNITSRVHVAVMFDAAPWTSPLTDAQGERVQQMPTGGTQLTARKPAVDFHDRVGFALDQANRGPDRGIRERTGKAVVFDHAPKIEVFDVDRIEPASQHRTQLVQAVLTRIGNLLMQPCDTAGLLLTTVRALRLSGQAPLRTGQQGGAVEEMRGVRNRLAGREGGQATDTEVNADRQAGLNPFHGLNFNDHRYIVATGWVARDRHRTGINLHASTDTQRQDSELGQCQPLRDSIELKGVPLIGRAVSRPSFLLEGGIGTAHGKEVGEGGLQVAQGLLKRNGRHIIQKCHLWIVFQRRQFLVTTRIGQAFSTLKGHRARRQHAVVHQAATPKCLGQVLSLFRRRIRSECPTAFHGLHINALRYNNLDALYPRHEWRGFTAGVR